jgi:hypothetical protein
MKKLKLECLDFLSKNPTNEEVEWFWINTIHPKTNDSIQDILDNY